MVPAIATAPAMPAEATVMTLPSAHVHRWYLEWRDAPYRRNPPARAQLRAYYPRSSAACIRHVQQQGPCARMPTHTGACDHPASLERQTDRRPLRYVLGCA